MIAPFDNLDVFLRHWGEKVYKGPIGSEIEIKAIFDNEGYLITDSYAAVNTVQPKLTCKTSDVADFVEDMRFVVGAVKVGSVVMGGTAYRGRNHTPTGTGFSEVELHKI